MNKRLILFMTSLTLAASPMSVLANEYTGPVATIEAVEDRATLQAATGEYKSWVQYDGRWGSMTLGGGDTMAQSGCLVTAIAMLMVHSGAADESGVDPGKLCAYLSNNGGFTGNSELYWAKVNGAVSGFKLANYSVKLEGSRYDKAAKIKRYLDAGQYVVVSVGNNAHWVAVNYADDNGNVYIFDPGYSYTSLFGSYNDAGITSMATFSSTGTGQGNIDTGDVVIENYTATGTVDVGASYLNVRAGVGTDKGYLTDGSGNRVTLADGAEVKITGKGKDGSGATWYRISINGLVGYVYGAYIDVSSSTVSGEGTPAKVIGSYVNIRSNAGTAYDIVGVAQKNADILVYESKTDSQYNVWYKVKYGSTVGYMLAEYVQMADEEAADETLYDEVKSGKVNAALVNVRKGPGYNQTAVKALSLNTKVEVLGEAKDSDGTKWYKIKYEGTEGYMAAEFVTITDDDTEAGDYTETKNGTVNQDWVNVRSGAGTNHAAKTSLRKGAAVTIVGEAKDSDGKVWYKIKYAGGEGYMRHDFITIKDDQEDGDADTSENAKVTAEVAFIRSGVGMNSSIVGNVIWPNYEVTILEESKDSDGRVWYKVKYMPPSISMYYVGYLRADYLEFEDSSKNVNYGRVDGEIKYSGVNIRSGPGTSYSSVGSTVGSGLGANILSVTKDSSGTEWYEVECSVGHGYIRADLVKANGTVGSGSTDNDNSNDTNYEQKTGKVNTSSVNVRKGAGTSNSVVGNISAPTAVTVVGEAKDSSGATWYKIKYTGGEGYMLAKYITLDDSNTDTDDGNNSNSGNYTEKSGKVNANGVNVRKGAGTSNSVVTALYTGAAVTITGEAKDSSGATWYKIKYTGGEGYIHSDYVTVTTGSSSAGGSTTTTPSYTQKTGKVNQDWVNVRAGAGTNYAARTSLRVNAAVTIIGEDKDSSGTTWYKIKHSGGEGYMRYDFITIGSGSDSNSSSNSSGSGSSDNSSSNSSTSSGSGSSVNVPTEGVAGKEGVINQPQVNVRKSADANAEVLIVLEQDVSVFIESVSKDSTGIVWYKVSFAGETGYMMGQYITVK